MVTETKVAETKVAENPVTEAAKSVATTEGVEPEPKTLPFKTQVELDAHIEKEAGRRAIIIADKGLVTYQKREAELKQQLSAAQDKKEDDALARLEAKQSKDYMDEEDLPDFQEAQKTLLQKARAFKKEQAEWDGKHGKLTEEVREALAFRKALGVFIHPEDATELFSTVQALAKKLVEAKTDAEMDLMVALEEEKLQRQAEAKPNKREGQPDSAFPTAPGGVDLNKLSASELIKRGLAKQPKK